MNQTNKRGPSRAERRRAQREGGPDRAEEPTLTLPKTFDKCPLCGCPARFTVEAMKGDLHIEDILGSQPALFSFEYHYDTPLYPVHLLCVGDVCVKCGLPYIFWMQKFKGKPQMPKQPPPGPLHLPRNPRG